MRVNNKFETADPLIKIKGLNVKFHTKDQIVNAVQGVDLQIKNNTTTALIGETGCGKSVIGKSIMRILPPNAHIDGKIYFKGENLLDLNSKKMQRLRGKELAVIPQNPSKSLNPVLKIKTQVVETLKKHSSISHKEAEKKTLNIFERLNLPSPKDQMEKYPHQLSGGMNQRVLAAISMSSDPSLLVADEPTKGLDAIVRRKVVELIKELKELTGSSILLITHDLKVASYLCDEVGIMYRGEIVEYTGIDSFLNNPAHPYSKALLNSLPENGLNPIKRLTPQITTTKTQDEFEFNGCKFFDYCPNSISKCKNNHPPLFNLEGDRMVRCFLGDKSRELDKKVSCLG
ncbi:ABC transporter ATP-binding protein [Natranaerofaba carboxydovora]|uniref:ABC transporter ATP-binding protein n=1 Tax=Natranaerofaba carboxydovora TaxID=2742683 RepID=UPI001F12A072|nr:ABC transporter ATP-binding protein [Natranaerofaba carboxydovora]UMZ72945.1 Oligopeptide transport ATP-binding protein OppD [Natranaerofaba carboxydovora]